MGSTEGRLSMVSTGVFVLMRSAYKDMMLGGAFVNGVSQNVRLCCCVRRVAADVSRGPNGFMSRGNWKDSRHYKTSCTVSLIFNNSTFCPHSVFVVLCGSGNKQRLFHCSALTDWFL